jgi:hypothetical protein
MSRVRSNVRPLRLVPLMLLVALAAAPAAEAKRHVPYAFYGVNANGPLLRSADGVQERQWAAMARSGVESARVVFSWAQMQPEESQPPDFEKSDAVVSRAARRRVRLLPIIFTAPRWARLYPDRHASPPADYGEYAAFARALVERYGPRGSFWDENPELPRRPVREWQIWNEPHLVIYWDAPEGSPAAWPAGYASMLRAVYPVIKAADPRARVVSGGLTNDSWNNLRALYRLGVRRYFDVLAIQTYTSGPRNLLRAFRLVRKVMRHHRDRRKPIWATEVSWPAARGRIRAPDYYRTIITTDARMARRLKQVYGMLVRRRNDPRYLVKRVYWYTWASRYRARHDIFDYSGLLRYRGGDFSARPALRSYRASARRFEGCSKTSTGACRR